MSPFFIVPPRAGFFIYPKESQMKTPEFLRQIMSSPAYMDKNSKAYAMAERYLNLLYPGMAQTDATGRMTEPEYDMTLTQFNKAQDALEAALEAAKQEAEAEYEEAGQEIDVDAYVELEETIDVRVLMPDGRTLSSKPYSPKAKEEKNTVAKDIKEMTKDQKFEQAYNKLKEPEGGYTDGKNQVRDEPTNMGIKQSTLDNYATKHPTKDLPADVKYLQPSQAKEIYKDMYWNNTEIPQIENDRVRNAVFDMNVMGGAARVVQRALNDFSDAGLAVDGKIGPKTVEALNSIPANKVSDFMENLKAERLEYLQQTKNWSTAKGGWTKRTNNY